MSQRVLISGFLAILAVTTVSGQGRQAPSNVAAPRAVLDKYCVGCHNARLKTGGLALDQLDLSRLADQAAIGEKVALKLRVGMMPWPGRPGPIGPRSTGSSRGWKTSWTATPPPT
jgi:hypothetical protein